MEFKDMQKRALQVREKYAQLERKRGREWSREDIVRGFVGDVGDLVKLTMAEDGVREISDSTEKLAHELADCLWAVLLIAEKYEVDIETAFSQTMDNLEARIEKETRE